MQGKNIQAGATFLARKARWKGGFDRRKNHGMEIPRVPTVVASAM
jgi:hypothetical protein